MQVVDCVSRRWPCLNFVGNDEHGVASEELQDLGVVGHVSVVDGDLAVLEEGERGELLDAVRLGQPLIVDLDKVDAVLLGIVVDALQLLEGPLACATVAGVPEDGNEVSGGDHFLELAGVDVTDGRLLFKSFIG